MTHDCYNDNGVCVTVTEPVIDPGSAAAALQKALSALGHSSGYASADAHTIRSAYGSVYADPNELRAGTAATTGSGTDSFYEAYIIRPTVVERSTIDSRACQGKAAPDGVTSLTITKTIKQLKYR